MVLSLILNYFIVFLHSKQIPPLVNMTVKILKQLFLFVIYPSLSAASHTAQVGIPKLNLKPQTTQTLL